MAVMMSLGILLRNSSFVSTRFIAVFYTGLGSSLFLAGILFGIHFIIGLNLTAVMMVIRGYLSSKI